MTDWVRVERGIVKRDGVFYVRFQVSGRTVTEATAARNIGQARAERAVRIGRVHDDRHVGATERRATLSDILDALIRSWKTAGEGGGPIRSLRTRTQQLETLRSAVGARRARDWTYQDAADYQAEGTTPAQRCTRSARLSILRAAFTVAKREGLITTIPSFPPRIDNVRDGFLEPEVFEEYIKEFEPLEQQVMTFAYRTGQRISRILGLHVTDIETTRWLVKAERDHGKKQRPLVPLLGAARTVAQERLQAAVGPGWLLFHRDGQPISRHSIHHRWKAAMDRKGLPWTIHDFRRSCARNLVNAGVDPYVAAEITGQSLTTFKRYAIRPTVAIERGAAQLESYLAERLRTHSAQIPHIPTAAEDK